VFDPLPKTSKANAPPVVAPSARLSQHAATPERTNSNQAMQRAEAAKPLAVGSIHDPAEHDADRIADRAMQTPAEVTASDSGRERAAPPAPQTVRRQPAASGVGHDAVPAAVSETLRGPGQPLDAATRSYFEPRFGFDLGDVRVHTGAPAAQSAAGIGARAFTSGADIVYGAGSRPGPDRLTAHELAHVAQNVAGTAPAAIRRAPGDNTFKIVSKSWIIDGRQIVVVEINGTVRRAFYIRLGTGNKGVGSAPSAGSWAPMAGIEEDVKNPGQPRINKDPYYKVTERNDPLRGYGNQTNKDAADWLKNEKIPPGEEVAWETARDELSATLKSQGGAPATASSASKRITQEVEVAAEEEIAGHIKPGSGTPTGGGGGGGSTASVENMTEKMEGSALGAESKLLGAERAVGRFAGLGAKAGKLANFLIEMGLPGPLDVLFLWISFFGSIAEAKEKLRSEYYLLGFCEGIAAKLLRVPGDRATRMLLKPVSRVGSVGEEVAGFTGIRGNATNTGVRDGWKFGGNLNSEQQSALLKVGRAAVAARGHSLSRQHDFDDVLELGLSLQPTITELFEIAREQELARERQRQADSSRMRGHGWAQP